MKSTTRIPTAEEIAAQCFIAFGAGVGARNVPLDVVRAMRSRYFTPITARASRWDKDRKAILINAQELGRICARLAAETHSESIGLRHLRMAAEELEEKWSNKMLIYCPCAMDS